MENTNTTEEKPIPRTANTPVVEKPVMAAPAKAEVRPTDGHADVKKVVSEGPAAVDATWTAADKIPAAPHETEPVARSGDSAIQPSTPPATAEPPAATEALKQVPKVATPAVIAAGPKFSYAKEPAVPAT
ncbi:MAG: hypothetical protein ACYDFT_06320 [Thermoplasmata archaeon]